MDQLSNSTAKPQGLTKNQMMKLNAPSQSVRLDSDAIYNFKILQARRCFTRDHIPFANFDLVVLDGEHRHQKTNLNCFAYNNGCQNGGPRPKVHGLGMMGTLGEDSLSVSRLQGRSFVGYLYGTYSEWKGRGYQDVRILHCLDPDPPEPIEGLAWNPPAGEYDLKMHPPFNYYSSKRIAGQLVEFQVVGGAFAGFKVRLAFPKSGALEAEECLKQLGYEKRTKRQWWPDQVRRLGLEYVGTGPVPRVTGLSRLFVPEVSLPAND